MIDIRKKKAVPTQKDLELCLTFETFINESFDKKRRVFSADVEEGVLKNIRINKVIKPQEQKFSYGVNKIVDEEKPEKL